MFKKIINFIKYSNVFTIIALVAFVAITSAVASNENVIKKVLGEEIIETQGVDNTLLLVEDLNNFDLEMKITNVFQDDDNYYIDYQYNTLGIQDNVWQPILRQKQLVISKATLAGRDLGLYVTEELGEVIDYQLAYLKEVQENEEEKGETCVVEITEYTGLIGLVLDTKTKELPGYEPVVKPPVAEETQDGLPAEQEGLPDRQTGSTQSMEPTDDDVPYLNPDETTDYVEDSYYYEFLIGNCLSSDGYWYNSTCNAEPELVDDDASHPNPLLLGEGDNDTPVCNTDNLDLCNTQDLCEGINLYWHSNVCNIEEEPPLTPPDQGENPVDPPVCNTDNLDLCDQGPCEGIGLYWYGGMCNIEAEQLQDDSPTGQTGFMQNPEPADEELTEEL